MSESSGGKRLIIVGSIIVGILIVILLVVWFLSKRKPTYVSYDKAIDTMQRAAAKYYDRNNDKLPVEDGDYILSYETLVSANLINPLNELLVDGNTCNAHIIVTNKSNFYTYTPYLNCENGYKTVELYKVLTAEDNIVTSGKGLYKDENGEYYFRGDVSNNYIKLGRTSYNKEEVDNIWRIMGIESDNTIKIRKIYPTNSSYVWDDRYNEEASRAYGYNKFELSKIKDIFEKLETSGYVLTKEYRNKIVAKKLCIAPRKTDDTTKDGSTECATLSEKEYNFGVIAPYEFMRASLDENCKNTLSRSCANYNYLATSQQVEWLVTPSTESSYQVYAFDGNTFDYKRTSSSNYLYLTTHLSDKVLFNSGSGTLEDPYTVR